MPRAHSVGGTRWAWWAIVSVAAVLPILATRFPPLTDYPQWVFQGYLVARLITARDATDAVHTFYHVSLTPVPNAAAPLGIGLLSLVLPLADAGRLFLLFCVLALGYGFAYLVRATQGQPSVIEFLGLPLAYGYFLYWGFVSYLLSIALALFGIGTLHRIVSRRPVNVSTRDYVTIILFSVAIYFCHLFGWVVFVFAVIAYAVLGLDSHSRRTSVRLILTLIPTVVLLLAYSASRGGQGTTALYGSLATKALALVSPLFLFLRTDPFPPLFPILLANAVCALLLLGVFFGNLARPVWPHVHRPLLAIVLALCLGALVAPFNWFRGLVAPDSRLIFPALLLAVAACRYAPWSSRRAAPAAGVVLVVLGLHLAEYRHTGGLLANVQAATAAAIPAGVPVLMLSVRQPPVRAACPPQRGLPSLGAPVLDWFGLYRLIATGGVRTDVFDSSIVVQTGHAAAVADLAVVQVQPADLAQALAVTSRGASSYPLIEVFGCPEDLQAARTALGPGYAVRAQGVGFQVLGGY